MLMAPTGLTDATSMTRKNDGVQSAMKVEGMPANLANDAMRAAWLADKECEAQARALLRTGK